MLKKPKKNNRYNEKIDITNISLLSADICQVNAQMVTLCIKQIRANAWPVLPDCAVSALSNYLFDGNAQSRRLKRQWKWTAR